MPISLEHKIIHIRYVHQIRTTPFSLKKYDTRLKYVPLFWGLIPKNCTRLVRRDSRRPAKATSVLLFFQRIFHVTRF